MYPHLTLLRCRSLAAVLNVNQQALQVLSENMMEGERGLRKLKVCLLQELHVQEEEHPGASMVRNE